MDLIRKYLVQIKSQLAGLTVSQKMLIALLGVFLVGTIFWTVVWSAKPQMVPLVEQSMTAEEINKVEIALKGNYQYQVSGDKVLVPVDQAYAIRGFLGASNNLPKNMVTAFDRVIQEQNSLFTPEATNARIWNNALATELRKNISSFPYLEDASVIISLGQQETLGRPPVPSTASVYVKTRDNAVLNSGQVQAIVDFVAGSVSGMKREDVHLNVNGQRTYRMPSDDTPMPANLLDYKRTYEDYLTTKLEAQLSNFGDVKIAVNVDPDLSSSTIIETLVDPKNAVSKVVSESNTDTSSGDGRGAGGEPGAQLNVGSSVSDAATGGGGGGRGTGSTSTVTHTQNQVVIGSTTKTSNVPAGVNIKALTASISLPRTYFVSLYHKQYPKEDPKADPDDTDPKFAGIVDKQLKSVRDQAKNVISAKTDEQVRVDWYDDTIVMKMPGGTVASATFVSGTMPLISQYVKPGFLVLVACAALGMMFRMVRRAVPVEGDVDTGVFLAGGGKKGKRKGGGGVEQFDSGDDVFGEANQGEAVLTGIELDDETLASRKMVDEVSVMIKDNPENAAALVKRWMTKNK